MATAFSSFHFLLLATILWQVLRSQATSTEQLCQLIFRAPIPRKIFLPSNHIKFERHCIPESRTIVTISFPFWVDSIYGKGQQSSLSFCLFVLLFVVIDFACKMCGSDWIKWSYVMQYIINYYYTAWCYQHKMWLVNLFGMKIAYRLFGHNIRKSCFSHW